MDIILQRRGVMGYVAPRYVVMSILAVLISLFVGTGTAHAATFEVISVSPSSGSSAGGDSITITGTNFVSGMTVRIDGVVASGVTVQNSTTITAQTPPGTPGTVTVSVTSPSSETVLANSIYTYTSATTVSIASVNPASGSTAGGTNITVAGGGFAGFVPLSNIESSVQGDFMCGIAAGSAYCWGPAGSGRLGDGSGTAQLSPVKVAQAQGLLAGKTVTDISLGTSHACVVASGEVYCWGNNASGQLGTGVTGGTQSTPIKVTQTAGILAGKTATTVSAGANHTCAVAGGEAYCWGANTTGQLGDNSTNTHASPAPLFASSPLAGKAVTDISSASGHTCAVAGGEAYCWGANTNGRVGDNSTNQRLAPVKVTQTAGILAGKTVTQISAGTNHTCAVAGGEAYCWGNNGSGRLGDNSTTQRLAPVKVTQTAGILADKTVTSITSGQTATCSVASAKAYCWGANNVNGRLGDGTTSASSVPVEVSAGNALFEKPVSVVTVGPAYSCALARQLSYCFGDNTNGEFGNGTTIGGGMPTSTSIQNGSVPLELQIGGATATILSQTSSQITAVTAASTSGVKDVSLRRTDNNQTATLASSYQYIGPPAITSISRTNGTVAGGETVSIYGESFIDGASVKFGSNTATNITYVSDQRIDVTTPSSTTNGQVTVTLTNPDNQTATLTNGFTYIPLAPTLSSINIHQGKMNGGNTIQLTGTNFSANTTPAVMFDGTAATNLTIVNATTATVTVPQSSSVKKADITYSDGYGHASTLEDNYTYLPQNYVFTNQPLVVRATEPGQMTIQARNPEGDPATIDDAITLNTSSTANTGYFALTTDESNGDPWDASSIDIAAGSNQAVFYYKDAAKGTPTISVSDGANTSASQVATINSLYKLLVTGISDPIAAGVPSSVTIQAVDYRGQPETAYTGTVRFSSSDPAAELPANSAVTAPMKGVRTFVNGVMMGTTGEQCITVTDISDASITGSQCDITTTSPPSGTIAQLSFITAEQFITTNKISSAITVQAQDSSGAPTMVTQDTSVYIKGTSQTAEYSISSEGSWTSTNPTLVIKAGTSAVSFYYRDSAPQTSQLLAADRSADTETIDNGLVNDSQEVTTGNGEPAKFVIDDPGSIAIHDIKPVIIRLTDEGSNTTTTDQDVSINLSSDSPDLTFHQNNGQLIGSAATLSIPAGSSQITAYVSSDETSTATITAADARGSTDPDSYDTGTLALMFTAAQPYSIGLTVPVSGPVKSGTPLQLQLYDEYGNVSPTSESTVIDLSSSASNAEFRASANGSPITKRAIPAGTSAVTVYYYSNELGNQTITVSGDNLVADSGDIVIEPGHPTSVVVTSPQDELTAGVARSLNIELRDSNNYPAPAAQDTTVTLTSSVGGEFSTDGTTWQTDSIVLVSGASSGSFFYKNTVAGSATISLTAPDDISGTYSQQIIAASPQNLHFSTDPQTLGKNVPSQPIEVTFSDEYSNVTAADNSTIVTLSDNPGTGEFSETSTGPWESSLEISVTPGSMSQTAYYRSAAVGEWEISATAPSYQGAVQSVTITNSNATNIELALSETSIVAGDIYPVTLTTTDPNGEAAPLLVDKSFTVASNNGGEFSEASTPFAPTATTILPAGSSSKTLYYRASETGTAHLTATSAGMTSSPEDIPVTAAEVQRFVLSPNMLSVPINTDSEDYTVTTQDAYGNISPVDTTTSVYLHSSSNTGDFSDDGLLSIAPGSSAITFTYRDSEFKDNPVELTASDKQTLDNPDVDIINGMASASIISAEPESIKLTAPSQSVKAGEFSGKITIDLTTTDGQPAYQDGSTSIELHSGEGGDFYQTTGDENSINSIEVARGSASVEVYYKGTTSGVQTVSAKYGTTTSEDETITILAAAPASMAMISAPQQIAANRPSGQITVKFYDEFMNEARLESDLVFDLGSSCEDGQFSLSDTDWQQTSSTTLNEASDQLVFYYQGELPGECTLTVESGELGQVTQQLTVTGGVASRLAVSLTETTIQAGQETTVTARVTDINGNVQPVSEPTIVYLASSSASSEFDDSAIELSPGQSQINTTFYDTVAGIPEITVSDQPPSEADIGLTDASAQVTVTKGAPAKLYVSGASASRVGEPYRLDIEIHNAYNIPTTVTGTTEISLLSDQPGTFSASPQGIEVETVSVPDGESSANIYYTQTQAAQTNLSLEAADLAGAVQTVTFSPMNIETLRFTTTNDAVTGEYSSQRVEFLDRYGNTATTDTPITVHLSSSSQSTMFYRTPVSDPITSLMAPINSTGISFYARNTQPETVTLTADDSPVSDPDTGIQKATRSLDITYGDPAAIEFNQDEFSVTRGATYGPLSVSVRNSAGSVVPATEDVDVNFQSSGDGEFSASANGNWSDQQTVTIPAGQTTAEVYLRNLTGVRTDNYNVITSANIDGTPVTSSLDYQVTYGTPAQLTITSPQQSILANNPSQAVTIELRNSYGVSIPAEDDLRIYLRSNHVGDEFSTGSQGGWGVNYVEIPRAQERTVAYYRSAVVGTHTVTAADTLPINSDTGLINADQSIIVTEQIASALTVTNISDPQQAGTPSSVVVIAKDMNGYTVPGYSGTVSFSSDDQTAILPEDYTFRPDIDRGSRTFRNGVAFKTTGEKNVLVEDGAGIEGEQLNITVTAANTRPVRSVAFTSPSSPYNLQPLTVSEPITVQRLDEDGVPTVGTGAFPIRISGTSATAEYSMQPGGPWSQTLEMTIPDGISARNIYFRDSTVGSHTLNAQDWVDSTDSLSIANGSMAVDVGGIKISEQTEIKSNNSFSTSTQSPYLFSNDEVGTIIGALTSQLASRFEVNDQEYGSDWEVELKDGDTVIDSLSANSTASLNYAIDSLRITTRSADLTLQIKSSSSQHGTVDKKVNIPVSPWSVRSNADANDTGGVDLKADIDSSRTNNYLATVRFMVYAYNDYANPVYQTSISATDSGKVNKRIGNEVLGGGQYVVLSQLMDANGSILAQDISSPFSRVLSSSSDETIGSDTSSVAATDQFDTQQPTTSADSNRTIEGSNGIIGGAPLLPVASSGDSSTFMDQIASMFKQPWILLLALVILLLIILLVMWYFLKRRRQNQA